MKIGIISDIHSNIDALVETIKYMKTNNVEKIICLGDIIGIGPYPEKCIDYLKENDDYILSCVKGNHEKYVVNGITRHNHKDSKPMDDKLVLMHEHNHKRISEKQKEYIKALKNKDVIMVNGKKILVEHYHIGNDGQYKKFRKEPTLEELKEIYDDEEADIYLFGHTHKIYYKQNDNKYYINPGSLGCPIDTNCASFGILEIDKDEIKYKQEKIKYNIENVIKELKELNYPEANYVIDTFFIKNKENLQIYNLMNKIEFLDEVATLEYEEWADNRERDKDARIKRKIEKIKNSFKEENFCKLVLLNDDELVGFISIFSHDCDTLMELSPWYSTMFVKKEYRGRGYSRLLNNAILNEARKRNIKVLYLKTDLKDYYEKFGAKFVKMISEHERLYKIDL